jgi:hypothetical protein
VQKFSPSPASEVRLAVARRSADAYEAESSVIAAVCAGSTARGQADRWSDLELLVVWESAPTDQQRRRIISAVGGQDPRALAVAVARRYGQIDHFWRWQMYVERENPLQLSAYFADVSVRIVQV